MWKKSQWLYHLAGLESMQLGAASERGPQSAERYQAIQERVDCTHLLHPLYWKRFAPPLGPRDTSFNQERSRALALLPSLSSCSPRLFSTNTSDSSAPYIQLASIPPYSSSPPLSARAALEAFHSTRRRSRWRTCWTIQSPLNLQNSIH